MPHVASFSALTIEMFHERPRNGLEMLVENTIAWAVDSQSKAFDIALETMELMIIRVGQR